eukprot:TRINITY_DN5759_c0_g1_i1.p1 TRINITY_DN5759_c0_g1~~TRINITY_DN5759_c0_g1_i1.p1  ORF type:complete len:440 (+),score=136.77 TRINITY_DN5759_c0_g1_i1:43-1320(+)
MAGEDAGCRWLSWRDSPVARSVMKTEMFCWVLTALYWLTYAEFLADPAVNVPSRHAQLSFAIIHSVYFVLPRLWTMFVESDRANEYRHPGAASYYWSFRFLFFGLRDGFAFDAVYNNDDVSWSVIDEELVAQDISISYVVVLTPIEANIVIASVVGAEQAWAGPFHVIELICVCIGLFVVVGSLGQWPSVKASELLGYARAAELQHGGALDGPALFAYLVRSCDFPSAQDVKGREKRQSYVNDDLLKGFNMHKYLRDRDASQATIKYVALLYSGLNIRTNVEGHMPLGTYNIADWIVDGVLVEPEGELGQLANVNEFRPARGGAAVVVARGAPNVERQPSQEEGGTPRRPPPPSAEVQPVVSSELPGQPGTGVVALPPSYGDSLGNAAAASGAGAAASGGGGGGGGEEDVYLGDDDPDEELPPGY